ncbi:hypothetical protein HN698_04410 [Candidatus Woesearchaeota archaeon]|jgi:hypothetical protein|nr:hypothetical protein [Candidatus Woesearchaeota archaeon]
MDGSNDKKFNQEKMKIIIPILILLLVFTACTQPVEETLPAPEEKSIACPYGIEQDPQPGQCGLYVDKDKDTVCDYSE